MSLNFIRHKEDFTCGHCGQVIIGDGYTNHCSHCLWSKHVDINPGDRAESCQGLMEPIGVEVAGGRYDIIHKCLDCKAVRKTKARPEDEIGAFLTDLI